MNWTDYYLGIAFCVAQKSPDSQTKHGCIITDAQNRVLGIGFNGFPRGINDKDLPTIRPEKYRWMYHAERNAVANCALRPEGGTAYVTGQSCNDCLYSLWQHGVKKIVAADAHGSHAINQKDVKWQEEFLKRTNMYLEFATPNLQWLGKSITEIPDKFFLQNV